MFPGPTPYWARHWTTHTLPATRKQEGESLSQPEPPLHHHLPAFTDYFAAPAIIEGGIYQLGLSLGHKGWGESKRGGRRSWGLVTLPKLNKYKETTTKNHLDGLPFGFGLEKMELRVFINVSFLLFYFISCYIMTPLELVFSHLLMLCFWCLGSLKLYLYLRHMWDYIVNSVLVLTPWREGEWGFAVVLKYIYLLFHYYKTAPVFSGIIYLLITQNGP